MLAPFLLMLAMAPQGAPPVPAAPDSGPVVEAGATYHHLWNGDAPDMGPWRAVHASVFWQPPLRVRPTFEIERQWRPAGAHVRAGAGAYVDWTPSLYSYQSIMLAPRTGPDTRFYPARRMDARVFVKLPGQPSFVTLAIGYTDLTFGRPQGSRIVNAGAILYGTGVITQATLYVNRNDPGALTSAAGNVSVQLGAEGRGWYGVSLSGGRELYRLGTISASDTADFTTATIGAFTRRWLTANSGIHAAVEYQRVIGSYSRVGVSGRLFVAF